MDAVRVACVFLLGYVSTCTGKAFNFGSMMHFTGPDPIETIPRCVYENKPCMIMVREYNQNGSVSGEFRSSRMCQCSSGTCPSHWDRDRSRTITRLLRTQENVMELQLKFCRRVQTERVCQPHEVALTLKGHTIMPQEVTSVNCRCHDNRSLHLQRFWYESSNPFIRNQNFVCSMPDCARGEGVPCVITRSHDERRETAYICKCPLGKQCRQARTWDGSDIIGRCMP